MKDNFDKSLALVLKHEGGYVNHPADPGGATNRGVTQAVYDAWRGSHDLPKQSVKHIMEGEIAAIYLNRYWDAVSADDLPAGLDYAMFDFAVNSGTKRAAQYLQRIVGVLDDGKIGPKTLAAVRQHSATHLIERLCANRMTFLRNLGTFKHFGKGWTRRVTDVERTAKGMVA